MFVVVHEKKIHGPPFKFAGYFFKNKAKLGLGIYDIRGPKRKKYHYNMTFEC